MTIQVNFFASLRELAGHTTIVLDDCDNLSLNEIWQRCVSSKVMPANTLCAINMEYAKPQDKVNEGDEIAFFPPVTGG